jgi:hypothetical protein
MPSLLAGREIDMRALVVAAIITSLAAPALLAAPLAAPAFAAEDPAKAEGNKALEAKKKETEEIDKAYKEMLKRTTPAQQPVKKADPWGNMR